MDISSLLRHDLQRQCLLVLVLRVLHNSGTDAYTNYFIAPLDQFALGGDEDLLGALEKEAAPWATTRRRP